MQYSRHCDSLSLPRARVRASPPTTASHLGSHSRRVREGDAWHFRAWTYALTVGQPLPTLPLWLADNLAVPLELEASCEETCRILRIP